MLAKTALAVAAAASAAALIAGHPSSPALPLPRQELPAPFHGQHTGVAIADLNGDGAPDLLFAAGRHWVDQPFALLNLGPDLRDDDDAATGTGTGTGTGGGGGRFRGVRFSDALPLGPPGGYYQVDALAAEASGGGGGAGDDDDARVTSTVLLVGGTCHVEKPSDFGACVKGSNTSATVLEVVAEPGGCSVAHPDAACSLTWSQVWSHPRPLGDRNGGFGPSLFAGDGPPSRPPVVLLGQGGVEIFDPAEGGPSYGAVPAYRLVPPAKTDPRSDFARYAGFAAGHVPTLGSVVAAGRRSDYDAPPRDAAGRLVGINLLVHRRDAASEEFAATPLDPLVSGEPYPGNPNYSVQTTNFAFADVDGDGIQDLLEGTFLQGGGRGDEGLVVEGHPLPQRIHFFGADGQVRETSMVLEYRHGETGRAVATGQIFPDSALPDVVFASSAGTVDVFANLGRDDAVAGGGGAFRGLELRHTIDVGDEGCMLRNLAVAPLARRAAAADDEDGQPACWIGIACALTCGLEWQQGRNEIVYVESRGHPCGAASPRLKKGANAAVKAA